MYILKRLLHVVMICGLFYSFSFSQTKNTAITEWLVIGSFPVDTIQNALTTPFCDDEAELMPVGAVSEDSLALNWQKITVSDGILNFYDYYVPNLTISAVYAASYVFTPQARNIVLSVSGDNSYVLWVNKEKLYTNMVLRAHTIEKEKIPVRLSAGWNRLLFKIIYTNGGYGMAANILNEQGNPVEDIVCTNKKPDSFAPPSLPAFAFIDKIYFAPSYLQEGKRIYPLVIAVKNLGQAGTHRGQAMLDTRISRWYRTEYTLNRTADIIFPIPARELFNKIDQTCGIRLYLNGGMCDDEIFKLHPEMILASLFAANDLPQSLQKYKGVLNNLDENDRWFKAFTGSGLSYVPGDLADCIDHALHEEWPQFTQMLDSVFADLLKFHTVIKQDTLHMIGQSNSNMTWLWRKSETPEIMQKAARSALSSFIEEPEFKYIQSQAAGFAMIEEQYPELFTAIQDAVTRGRFFPVGGMWVEPDLSLISGESLIRQILYGKRYFREKFGIDCITAYAPDTFGYTWALPQILKKSGFKYLITTKIRWNNTNAFPHSIFSWISPDGSDILTCLPMGLNLYNNPGVLANHLLKFKKEGYNNVPVLYGDGDHGGGPTSRHFTQIRKMAATGAYPAVYHDDLDNYMQRIEKKYPDVPDYQDELYPESNRGTLTNQAKIKKLNRRSEIALEEAEKLAVFSKLEYPSSRLDDAWEKTLFNQCNNILPGTGIPEMYVDAEKDYEAIHQITNTIIDTALQAIIGNINLNNGKDIPAVVFNTLSWNRDGLVSLQLEPGITIKEIYDKQGNKPVFQQMDNNLIFNACNVPQCGYKTWWLRKGNTEQPDSELKIGPTSLENKYLLVEINPQNGNIKRIYDKRVKREILARGKEANVLQFFEDKPEQNDAGNIMYSGASWTCEKVKSIFIKEKGPVRAILRVVREYGKSTFTQDYTLYHDNPQLDIVTRVDWREQHTLVKAAFPVNVDADFATFDLACGSIQRATKPQTPAEKAKFEVAAHKYIDLSRSDYGVSLLNDCKYGHDVNHNVMRITLLRSPLTPDPQVRSEGYVNPFADQGIHEFVYSVYPHPGDHIAANTVRRAFELNYPLHARLSKKHKGALPVEHSFVTLDADNLILTTVKKAEDSNEHIIRLYETHGKAVDATLRFSAPLQFAWKTDLMENKENSLEVNNNQVTLHVNPYEIVTLVTE